jgi:hypothetical protein
LDDDESEEEEVEKNFLQIINIARSSVTPVGFVFFTKNQTIQDLRYLIKVKEVLPKGTIYNFFTQEKTKVATDVEYDKRIKEVAFKVLKENLKIFVKTKASKVKVFC